MRGWDPDSSALEQVLRQSPVGLIALDHVGAGGEGAVGNLDLAAGPADFDALRPEDVDELGDARLIALHGNDERERRFRLSRLDRVPGLLVEVLDHQVREHRRELQARQDAGLHVVGVVAPRPVGERARRNRQSAIPLARLAAAASRRRASGRRSASRRRRRRPVPDHLPQPRSLAATAARRPRLRVLLRPRCRAVAGWPRPAATDGGAAPGGPGWLLRLRSASRPGWGRRRSWRGDVVAGLRLAHPHHAVVVVSHGPEVAGRPAVHEGMRIDARHAPLGHLRQLEVREEGQLGEENRIEVRILRRRAAVGVEQRLRLVQVVHDRRMRREIPVGDGAHRDLRQVDVAVVVVEDALPQYGTPGTPPRPPPPPRRPAAPRRSSRPRRSGPRRRGRRRQEPTIRGHDCDRTSRHCGRARRGRRPA